MKALLCSFLFLFSFNLLNGQIPFAPVGARYYTKQECPPYDASYTLQEVVEEDTIQGKYCTKLESLFVNQIGQGGEVFVHQDGYRVFIYNEELNTFHLVYDFSLIEGDAYRVYMNEEWFDSDSATVEVLNVDTISIGNVQGVRQELKVTKDSATWWAPSFEVTIDEGIGGIMYGNRLLTPFWTVYHMDCFIDDLCYWSPITGPVSLEGNSQPCIPTSIDVKHENNYFSVFPNPSFGKAVIEYELPNNNKNLTAHIFYSTGQLENQIKLENNFGKIEIESLPTGIYFISMTSDGRVVGSEKLIVVE